MKLLRIRGYVAIAAVSLVIFFNKLEAQCNFEWDSIPSPGRAESFAVFDEGAGPALYCGFYDTAVPQGVCKWDGSNWIPLGGPWTNSGVYALAVFDDGSGPHLYAAGGFSNELLGSVFKRVSNSWIPIIPEGEGHSLAVFDGGKGEAILAGGFFNWRGDYGNFVLSWDGSALTSVGSLAYSFPLFVIQEAANSNLYCGQYKLVGGSWTKLGGDLDNGTGFILSLGSFNDGGGVSLYAGGHFTNAGALIVNNIAKWNGAAWVPLGIGIVGQYPEVFSMRAFDEGDGNHLFVGGAFNSAGQVAANAIARWDGSNWSAVASGVGANNGYPAVHAMQEFNDGSGLALYVGGEFDFVGGMKANGIARWRPVGNPPTILVQPGDKTIDVGTACSLEVVASFAKSYSWLKNDIAIVDNEKTSGSKSSQLKITDIGFEDAGVYTVVITNPCGATTSADSEVVVVQPCVADIGPSSGGNGAVDVDDLLIVIGFWNATPPAYAAADVTGDGTVDVDDLLAVINAWGPCP